MTYRVGVSVPSPARAPRASTAPPPPPPPYLSTRAATTVCERESCRRPHTRQEQNSAEGNRTDDLITPRCMRGTLPSPTYPAWPRAAP
jgi:hypothetical protein